MSGAAADEEGHPAPCAGCVYFPSNLPRDAYSTADWALLQSLSCSADCTPGDAACAALHKSSCSLVDLRRSPIA